MKKCVIVYFLSLCLLAAASCKKSGTPPPPTGELEITGFTPKYVAKGEIVIITGTGFDPSPSGNKVFFYNDVLAEIVSASATELKVKAPELLYGVHLTPGSYTNIVVEVNGKRVSPADYIYYKRPLEATDIITSTFGVIMPGDSLTIKGSGFSSNPALNSAQIDGKNLIVVRSDSSFFGTMRCFYPASSSVGVTAVGDSTAEDTATKAVNLKITAQGATTTKPVTVRIFPQPYFQFEGYQGVVVAGYYTIQIKHKSILPGTFVKFDGGNIHTFSRMQTEYTDEITDKTLFMLPQNLPPGTYQFSIVRNSKIYLSRTLTFL